LKKRIKKGIVKMKKENNNTGKRIRHLVIFNFQDGKSISEKDNFLQNSKSILTSIGVVKNFEILKQINTETNYPFGFSMEFKDMVVYEAYKNNPIHLDYVTKEWHNNVEKYLGMDFEDYSYSIW
jgi:hypothetical protein